MLQELTGWGRTLLLDRFLQDTGCLVDASSNMHAYKYEDGARTYDKLTVLLGPGIFKYWEPAAALDRAHQLVSTLITC